MFIMRKDLFFEYCEFLFGILFELEKRIDLENYSILGKRCLGYLGEILLTVFFLKKNDENLKVKSLGVTFIQYVTLKEYFKGKIKEFIHEIFSITNSDDKKHKVITLLGIRIYINRRKKREANGCN